MALSKVAESKTTEVIQLITPQDSEDIQMGIEMSAIAHLLDRLTDLYPDPIVATVREVISNAYDATVLVPERDRQPIKIFNPTQENPSFIVEDLGVGMSAHDVRNIYSKYGASTKMLDMRQIGAYGLGAKAPLAYCTEFLVETTKHGMTTVFSVARKAEGNFTKIIREIETSKPNGTRVTIPIKHRDAEDFKAAVELYRKFSFDTSLEIDGKLVSQPNYTEITDSFTLEPESRLRGRVWVRNDAIHKSILTRLGVLTSGQEYIFSLSGWPYKTSSSYSIDTPDFVFELKPGVVDFSSSRDDITKNDRSRALELLASNYLRDKEAGLEDVFKAYRTLGKASAIDVFARALRSSKKVTDDGKLWFRERTSYSYGNEEELEISRFTTNESFNPSSIILKQDKKVIQSAMTIPKSGKSSEVTHIGSDGLPWYGETLFYSSKIGTMNERMIGRAELTTSLYSFTELASRFYVDELVAGKETELILVTGADSKTIRKILAGRKNLSELPDYPGKTMLFTRLSSASVKAQIAFAKENFATKVEVKDASSVIDAIKDARAEARKEKTGSVSEESVRLKRITSGQAEEAKILNTYAYDTETVTPKQIIDSNAIVILHGTATTDSALIGAANSGITITDRPIYATDRQHLLKASHYKALENYDGIIAARGFNGRSKLASTIGEKRTFYGRVLNSKLLELTPELMAKLYIDSTPVGEPFIHEFYSYVSKVHSDNRALKKALKLTSDGYKLNARVFMEITDDQLDVKLKSQKKMFQTLKDFLKDFNGYSDSVTRNVCSQFVRNNHRLKPEDVVLKDFIYEMLYTSLLEKLAAAGVKV